RRLLARAEPARRNPIPQAYTAQRQFTAWAQAPLAQERSDTSSSAVYGSAISNPRAEPAMAVVRARTPAAQERVRRNAPNPSAPAPNEKERNMLTKSSIPPLISAFLATAFVGPAHAETGTPPQLAGTYRCQPDPYPAKARRSRSRKWQPSWI